MRFSVRRPGMPLALIALAAAIGFLGYNLGSSPVASAASTASPVNIADPTTPTNLAHVSSAGALSTSVSGLVNNVPGTPATPLNLDVTGVVGGEFTELVEPTAAHIDLTSLTVAADAFENSGVTRIFFVIEQAPTGTAPGDCTADATGISEIQQFDLQPGATVTLSPSSPIVMSPPSGEDQCVAFGIEADTGTDTGQVHVSATGFVVSGTYAGPHNTGSGDTGLALMKQLNRKGATR
jgi:hypothetical protein